MSIGDFRNYDELEESRSSKLMAQLMKLSERLTVLSSSQTRDEQQLGAIQTALTQLNLTVSELSQSLSDKVTSLSGSARSIKILPDVVRTYSSVLSLVLAGDRSYELVCSGAMTSDTVIPYVKQSPPGFRLVRAVCTSADRITLTIAEPTLSVGFTGTMTTGLVALR